MIRELARQKFKETNEKARYVDWSSIFINSPLFPRYFQHHTISEKAEKIGMSTLEDDQ